MFTRFFLSRKFLVLLLLLFLVTRVIHITADPPKNLSWSLGLFFDEGIYNHNARNQILFGQWKLDEWNDYYYSAILTWIKYLILCIIGVGRAQIRLISVAFSMVSLLVVYLASKESYGKKTGVMALLLFGTNYISTMYSRLGMQDTQTLTIFIIAFYLWQKGMNRLERSGWQWYFMLSGMMHFIGYTFKNLFLYLLPAPFVALGLYIVLRSRDKIVVKKLLNAFGYFTIGTSSAFLIWFVTFYLPNKKFILQFGTFFTTQQMFPRVRISQFLINFYQTPFFKYFSNTPVVLLGSLLFLLYIYYVLCSKMRSHIHPSDIFLAVWFWAVFAFSGIIEYRPTRYFLPIIPPMCILAAKFIVALGNEPQRKPFKKIHWCFFPLSLIWLAMIIHRCIIPWGYKYLNLSIVSPVEHFGITELIVSVVAAAILTAMIGYFSKQQPYNKRKFPKHLTKIVIGLLIILSLYMDGKYYYQWAHAPEYVVANVGKDIMAYIGSNGYIGGMDAPGVAYDTPYKTLISWDQYVNYAENPITKYKLTHLFLTQSKSINETRYYFQKYPQAMQRATLLKQYLIKDTIFKLFSLVETRLEAITLPKTTFESSEAIEVKMQIKNYDFRQPKKLFLNWFLYPLEVLQDAAPASMGQEIQGWVPSEQAQEFIVSGMLPPCAGKYSLLVSWDAVRRYRDEAEQMQRHLGEIVYDMDASGNRVVYHNSTAFPESGFLAFGNYQSYHSGIYETMFRLRIANNTLTEKVARIDVVANYSKTLIRQWELRGTDFPDATRYHHFNLPYVLKDYTANVEFRVFSYGSTDIWIDAIHTFYREGTWYKLPIIVRERPDQARTPGVHRRKKEITFEVLKTSKVVEGGNL